MDYGGTTISAISGPSGKEEESEETEWYEAKGKAAAEPGAKAEEKDVKCGSCGVREAKKDRGQDHV